MERIRTSTSDFARIRQNGGVYVDKTDRILPLVDMSVGKLYFLSRPRRFGKSLLLSMIKYLFPTGYLTIKETVSAGRWMAYRLGFPNVEVADGFNTWLARAYVDASVEQTSSWQRACREAVTAGDAGAFVEALQSFFLSIGYDPADRLSEQAYQCVAVAIMRFIGIDVAAEATTSRGRIDTVICSSR